MRHATLLHTLDGIINSWILKLFIFVLVLFFMFSVVKVLYLFILSIYSFSFWLIISLILLYCFSNQTLSVWIFRIADMYVLHILVGSVCSIRVLVEPCHLDSYIGCCYSWLESFIYVLVLSSFFVYSVGMYIILFLLSCWVNKLFCISLF